MACGKITVFTIFVIFCAFFAVNANEDVIVLDENNWTDILKNEWMVEFYAPWCPACKGLETTWKQFANWGYRNQIKVGKVDVTTSPGLSGRFMVTALPTIFHVINGEFRQYKGSRDKDSFISFINEEKWINVEPIPSWKFPNSLQMSVISSFFKLSQTLRQIHNKLMEEWGLPTWGSYLIFAVATIFMGALLGLILVCVIDFIYPPKQIITTKSTKENAKKDKASDDELDDALIKDDLLDDTSHSEAGDDGDEGDVDGDDEEPTKKSQSNPNSPKIKKRKPRRGD